MLISEKELSLIASYQPVGRPQQSLMQAAVAIVMRDGIDGTEFLMIQRAFHENDPWSGQMAFPGGKIEDHDKSAKAAAIRETMEEVGLSLSRADYIGQLDDTYGLKVDDKFSVHVACFVFKPEGEVALSANYEVADMVWVPMKHLLKRQNAHDFQHPHDSSINMPAVKIDLTKEQILWGLSLRMLSTLFDLLGVEMTVLSEQNNADIVALENRAKQIQQEFLKKQNGLTNRR